MLIFSLTNLIVTANIPLAIANQQNGKSTKIKSASEFKFNENQKNKSSAAEIRKFISVLLKFIFVTEIINIRK